MSDVSCRIGGKAFALVLPETELSGTLIRQANQALCQAKKNGRNRCEVFQEDS